ncbi:tubby-like protein 8 [Cynara cardunculus var. scolymus]|uniref:tubby-like protein 8 n=1 Tax=Cynara cardunculus var. scolymus TaxID=59895 RepID=UPI000D6252A8|nr:tubby-like protein 8 [Cynara cardunculus var. scolymus]
MESYPQPPTSSFSKPSSSLPKWQIPTLLTEIKHNRSSSDPIHDPQIIANLSDDKENSEPNKMKNNNCKPDDKENVDSNIVVSKQPPIAKTRLKDRAWKPSSLQLCMQLNDPNPTFGSNFYEPIGSNKNNSGNIWDHSDSEAAPASSWSTLPNRSLLCRPLPVDIGRCTCIIVKEKSVDGLNGGTLYTLYTNEGQGRQNRKLAVAHHRRHNGRSEFIIAQNTKGILCCADDSYVGSVTANLMGSKYHIWDQGRRVNSMTKHSKLLALVAFVPTIATWTGSYRSMKIWLPKHQSMQLKNTTQAQHINGLPKDWEERMDRVHQLFSRVPHYNNVSKQYELDFRNRGKAAGLKIQSSAKNFQLTLEKNGRQTILQLGRIGKSKYVMDYRYPLTGYQAFSICLASIDSKLCCTM